MIWADRVLLVRVLPAAALILILALTAWPRASELAVAGDELLSAALAIGQELPRALLASMLAILCGWRLADGGIASACCYFACQRCCRVAWEPSL